MHARIYTYTSLWRLESIYILLPYGSVSYVLLHLKFKYTVQEKINVYSPCLESRVVYSSSFCAVYV
jgi:hypothetical protein